MRLRGLCQLFVKRDQGASQFSSQPQVGGIVGREFVLQSKRPHRLGVHRVQGQIKGTQLRQAISGNGPEALSVFFEGHAGQLHLQQVRRVQALARELLRGHIGPGFQKKDARQRTAIHNHGRSLKVVRGRLGHKQLVC